jgi:hypothetical protein
MYCVCIVVTCTLTSNSTVCALAVLLSCLSQQPAASCVWLSVHPFVDTNGYMHSPS